MQKFQSHRVDLIWCSWKKLIWCGFNLPQSKELAGTS